MIKSVGSICSGIEAASVAWNPLGIRFDWFSEIAPFPSAVLSEKYPTTPNVGDMTGIPGLIARREISAPDLICGGTPCQAFSVAGRHNGLNDDRGNLTIKFVDIIDTVDNIRLSAGRNRCRVFWENVEGVATDKTNAFGCLISSLAGLQDTLTIRGKRWPDAGLLYGEKRNVAWRVLDAKYFGVPQQRRRLYLVAGGKDFKPGNVLFETHTGELPEYPSAPLVFEKEGHLFEVFREYTDCLYSAYGTKWNGNAAAYNGSLFVVQDGRIRRFSPLETERLMGFPDNYTDIKGAKKTNRYQGTGNSWAVPVVQWIGKRLICGDVPDVIPDFGSSALSARLTKITDRSFFIDFGRGDIVSLGGALCLNCTARPENGVFTDMRNIVSPDAPEDIYLSPAGCRGILRRKTEGNKKMNPRLEEVLLSVSDCRKTLQ